MAAKRKTAPAKSTQSSGASQKQAEKKTINAQKKEPETMFVQDKLATLGPRTHELMDSKGRPHIFTFPNHATQIKVPSDVVTASRLIQNDGFIVRKDLDGQPLKARVQTEEQAVLQADECVAHYDELTTKALLRRCLDRGADYNTRTNRDAMVTFLMGATVDNMADDEEDDDFSDEEGNETEISEEELEETAEDVVARLQAQNDAMANLTEEQLAAALQQQAG